jgi:tetratricopeptide (TPR) repeat protein
MDHDIYRAGKEYEKGIAFLTGLTNTRSLVNDMNHCKESSDYKSASEKMNKALILESRLLKGYVSALNLKDTLWWSNEIRKLNQQIDQVEDPFRLSAYKRVKSFISMAAYSLSNSSLKANDLTRAQKITGIYQMIDPGNPDAYYFRALYYLKTGQYQMAMDLFTKAVNTGFSDFQKARQELPEEIYKTGMAKE